MLKTHIKKCLNPLFGHLSNLWKKYNPSYTHFSFIDGFLWHFRCPSQSIWQDWSQNADHRNTDNYPNDREQSPHHRQWFFVSVTEEKKDENKKQIHRDISISKFANFEIFFHFNHSEHAFLRHNVNIWRSEVHFPIQLAHRYCKSKCPLVRCPLTWVSVNLIL